MDFFVASQDDERCTPATTNEVKDFGRKASATKKVVAEQIYENHLFKKRLAADRSSFHALPSLGVA